MVEDTTIKKRRLAKRKGSPNEEQAEAAPNKKPRRRAQVATPAPNDLDGDDSEETKVKVKSERASSSPAEQPERDKARPRSAANNQVIRPEATERSDDTHTDTDIVAGLKERIQKLEADASTSKSTNQSLMETNKHVRQLKERTQQVLEQATAQIAKLAKLATERDDIRGRLTALERAYDAGKKRDADRQEMSCLFETIREVCERYEAALTCDRDSRDHAGLRQFMDILSAALHTALGRDNDIAIGSEITIHVCAALDAYAQYDKQEFYHALKASKELLWMKAFI